MIAAVTVFAVFCDILGTAMVMPALASLCAYADGGPAEQIAKSVQTQFGGNCTAACQATIIVAQREVISPYAFSGEKGAWNGRPPVGFSLSMNLVMAIAQFGSALGSRVFGWMCDNVGCKAPMQICLGSGLIG